MTEHESSVNYKSLISDLADMYPFEVGEVIIVELIANSLDAGASEISIEFDHSKKVLVITDNGEGMDSGQFEQYHNFAAGLKTRGTGIGFAGVGAKISFNIADRVLTETRSEKFVGGSDWHFRPNKKLIWEDIKPTHLISNGTRVEIQFKKNANLNYSNREDIVGIIRRHYLPLLDSKFLKIYKRMGFYKKGLSFSINGKSIITSEIVKELNLKNNKEFYPERNGKLFGYGIFGIAEKEYPLGPNRSGVLISTYGKIIKSELFNQYPSVFGPKLIGLVEVPELVEFLTTSKTDFSRRGKYKKFEKLYNPIRQEFKDWLKTLGLESTEIISSDETKQLERELKKILNDIPELSKFFSFWSRKKLPIVSENGSVNVGFEDGIDKTIPVGSGKKAGENGNIVDTGTEEGSAPVIKENGKEKGKPISRTSRRGPKIAFIENPERKDLGWVEGNNIVINQAHPSYKKIKTNARARNLHNLFTVAIAIHRFLGEGSEAPDFMFIDRMMSAWGEK